MMDVDFDVNKILQERLAASLGLIQYKTIIDKVKNVDVSKDSDFQRTYNGFYLVRRNEQWRREYYTLFENVKHKDITFGEIITELYHKTGNIEASFSSKMLATINPEKPIWDRYVLQNLSLKIIGSTQEAKLNNAIQLYHDIELWYETFLHTIKAEECLAAFDKALPDYKWISDIKKIDAILWSIR